jgi:branched-chain amino acid transport system substrate-binding protein
MRGFGAWGVAALMAAIVSTTGARASAEKKYDVGASDTEIKKIGTTTPFTGPASAYAVIGQTIAACFKKINGAASMVARSV